jgi:hypothetical protein
MGVHPHRIADLANALLNRKSLARPAPCGASLQVTNCIGCEAQPSPRLGDLDKGGCRLPTFTPAGRPPRGHPGLTTAVDTCGRSWTPAGATALYGPVSWTVVDWPGPGNPPENRTLRPHRVTGQAFSRHGGGVQQPHRLRAAARDFHQSLTCSNDRERPLCREFASRGSGVRIPSTPRQGPISKTGPIFCRLRTATPAGDRVACPAV